MVRTSVCFGFMALFVGAWVGVSSAQDEVFSISQNLGLWNLHPKVAMNPATGDIVVAWVQINSKTDNQDIYAAYCKYLGDGKFKAGKPRLVSQVKGRNDPPNIAFDQAAKSYLVVWSRLEWFSATSKAFNILARRTNSTGRLKGKEVHITDSEVGYSEQPLIMSMDSATGVPAGSGGYLIFFVHYPFYATGIERGLNAVCVDAKGRKTGEPQNTFNPLTMSNKYGEVWLYDAAGGNGGNFIVPLVDAYSDDTSDTWLAEIDPSGKSGKAVKVTDEALRSPSVSALSSKMYLLTWTKPYEADFYHQLYKTGLKKIKKPFTSAGEYSYY